MQPCTVEMIQYEQNVYFNVLMLSIDVVLLLPWLLLLLRCLPVNLMGLLKWRDNPRGLESYLRLFMKVDGEEIVKVGEGS